MNKTDPSGLVGFLIPAGWTAAEVTIGAGLTAAAAYSLYKINQQVAAHMRDAYSSGPQVLSTPASTQSTQLPGFSVGESWPTTLSTPQADPLPAIPGMDATTNNGTIFNNDGLRAEAGLLKGKKHGIKWAEGPARAIKDGIPQGQFGSADDVEAAVAAAGTLEPGANGTFPLPEGHTSVVHLPDGTTVPARQMWVRRNKSGTVHAYPTQ